MQSEYINMFNLFGDAKFNWLKTSNFQKITNHISMFLKSILYEPARSLHEYKYCFSSLVNRQEEGNFVWKCSSTNYDLFLFICQQKVAL